MKEKIFQFLKTKLSGVQESYLKGVAEEYSKTITEEANIETVLTQGVIDAIKLSANQLQAEGDRRATEAGKTAVENFRKKNNLDENGKPIVKDDPPKSDPNEPEWFKNYRDRQEKENAELREKLEQYEKKGVTTAMAAKVKAKLTELKVPESFYNGRSLDVENDEQVDKLVESINGGYTAFRQELVNEGVIVDPPKGGGGEGDKANIDDYLEEKFPETETKK